MRLLPARWLPLGLTGLLVLLTLTHPLAGLGLAWQCADGTPCPLLSHDGIAASGGAGLAPASCCHAPADPGRGLSGRDPHHADGQTCLAASDDRAAQQATQVAPQTDVSLPAPGLDLEPSLSASLAPSAAALPPEAPDPDLHTSRAPPSA